MNLASFKIVKLNFIIMRNKVLLTYLRKERRPIAVSPCLTKFHILSSLQCSIKLKSINMQREDLSPVWAHQEEASPDLEQVVLQLIVVVVHWCLNSQLFYLQLVRAPCRRVLDEFWSFSSNHLGLWVYNGASVKQWDQE